MKHVNCKYKDQVHTVDGYSFHCEDPKTVCGNSKNFCFNNCNGRGKCLADGRCWCHPFFYGDSCEYFENCDTKKYPKQLCLDVFKTNKYIFNKF